MSISLTNVQQTEFDALVKVEYRSRGFMLRDTVRLRTDIIGNTCQFRKVGQVIANQVAYQNTISIQDATFTGYIATLLKYAAGTGVDSIEDLTVNFDTKRELALVVAMAIGRRSDQIIIDAMTAATTNTNVDPTSPTPDVATGNATVDAANNVIMTGNSNMTYSKLRNIVQYFDQDAVPVAERFVAMSGNNLRNLLNDEKIISRFYTSNDAVSDGSLNYKELLGMNVRTLPSMTEGGLPVNVGSVPTVLVNTSTSAAPLANQSIRTCFAWHKMAVGMAIGQDMRTEVSYLPRETTWFVNGLFFAGATVVDNRGFFKIFCNESDVT